jgi:DNA modification methylase
MQLGLAIVPVVQVCGLSAAKKRALALADNKIAANAGWDRELLATELAELSQLLIEDNLDISITGFDAPEIDQLSADFEEDSSDPADAIDARWLATKPVSQRGHLRSLRNHCILCGDAREPTALARLMGKRRAAMAFLDPPYNARVRGIVGRGLVRHQEFAMASGELSPSQFVDFLTNTLSAAASVSQDGALHYVCIDWRHIDQLLEASGEVYGATLNLVVWVKSNAGQGSFYRSQHELIAVFRVGDRSNLNNIELGHHGRNRSNVWHYQGANTFRAGRMDDLKSHPTVKPIALVADAMRDCTRRGDIVIDAAERVGRHARAIEIEPRFVDVAIRRWQAFTRRDAIHAESGLTFDELVCGSGTTILVEQALNKRIKVREDGRTRSLSKFEALVLTMLNKALQGDVKTQIALFGLLRSFGMIGEEPEPTSTEPVTAHDGEIIADFLRRNSASTEDSAAPENKIDNRQNTPPSKEKKP